MATKKTTKPGTNLYTPRENHAYLDQYVTGQDAAKRTLSVAIYNHFKRILHAQHAGSDITIEKSNILLMGPTGSGKTFLVQTIARLLNLPCYIQDCTKITESGFVGSDIEDCLVGLLRNCNYDVKRAETGIVVLDEIDKCACHHMGLNLTARDPGGEGVQQGLLKIVEGDTVGVPPMGGRKHPEAPLMYINTKNILFIASGAFVGLEDSVKRRMGKHQVGFSNIDANTSSDIQHPLDLVTTDDVCQFGMIPEFVGRFPVMTHTDPLTEKDLVRILTEPQNALTKQYQELLRLDNTILRFSPEVLTDIARRALKMKTGARALRGIMDQLMMDIMYSAPDNRSAKKPVVVQVDTNNPLINKIAV